MHSGQNSEEETKEHQVSKEQRCPACRSPDLEHEIADRWACCGCGYRVIISDDGTVRDWLNWTTAGRKGRARKARRKAKRGYRLRH